MRIMTIMALLFFTQFTWSYQYNSHKKVTAAVANFQSAYWILDDLTNAHLIYCKTPQTQEMFDHATKNIFSATQELKKLLSSQEQLSAERLQAIAKLVNDSYNIYKSLLFLHEIIIKDEITNLKFEQSRFGQMIGIIKLEEYAENGDEEIFTPLNQKNSAMRILMSKLHHEWHNTTIPLLPKYLSQTDLRFIQELVKQISPGGLNRHLKAYFTTHHNGPQQKNFKGDLANLILQKATGWTIESLAILPAFVNREKFYQAQEIIIHSAEFSIPAALNRIF